jgi:hypothetical protein
MPITSVLSVLPQDSEEERSNTLRTQHDRLKEEVAAYKAQVMTGLVPVFSGRSQCHKQFTTNSVVSHRSSGACSH